MSESKQVYYYTITQDDRAYQITTSVPQLYIRSILIQLGGLKTPFSDFIEARGRNMPIESPIAKLLRDLKENTYEVFFPTGHVWNKANNNIHVENMIRYRYYADKYQRQEAISANEQKG